MQQSPQIGAYNFLVYSLFIFVTFNINSKQYIIKLFALKCNYNLVEGLSH